MFGFFFKFSFLNRFILTALSFSIAVQVDAQQPSDALVVWSSDEGIQRLSRSRAKVDFFPLANHFESQNNKIY